MKKIAAERNYNNLRKMADKSKILPTTVGPHQRPEDISGIKAEYLQKNNNNLEYAFEAALSKLQENEKIIKERFLPTLKWLEEAQRRCEDRYSELQAQHREIQGLPPVKILKGDPTPMLR